MSKIIQVKSFQLKDDNFICQINTNKYTENEIIIKVDDFELFLDNHGKLVYADTIPITIREYLANEPIMHICDDLADYIICKVIDFDVIFSDIFNHIQKLAKC